MQLYDSSIPALPEVAGHPLKDFSIAVTYCHRVYRYKVEQLPGNGSEEVFRILTPRKTVLLTSRLTQTRPGAADTIRQYFYDRKAISNKFFMTRVIHAIEQQVAQQERGLPC